MGDHHHHHHHHARERAQLIVSLMADGLVITLKTGCSNLNLGVVAVNGIALSADPFLRQVQVTTKDASANVLA